MAVLVKCPSLDFGSGHDLMVYEFESHVGLWADSVQPALDSHALSLSLSKYINKLKKKKRNNINLVKTFFFSIFFSYIVIWLSQHHLLNNPSCVWLLLFIFLSLFILRARERKRE